MPMPLGRVVAMCELVDVVPMGQIGSSAHKLTLTRKFQDEGPAFMGSWDLAANRPLGDFTPGRFAWLLDKIEPLAEPIAAKGAQGIWTWQQPETICLANGENLLTVTVPLS